jgi:hypothetical protein
MVTLENLHQISFADLNTKSKDDFNPIEFGFEMNPGEQTPLNSQHIVLPNQAVRETTDLLNEKRRKSRFKVALQSISDL